MDSQSKLLTFWHDSKIKSVYTRYSHVLFLIVLSISENDVCHILRALETQMIIYEQDLHSPEKHNLIRPRNGHSSTLPLRM